MQESKMIGELPVPFQCTIVNKISSFAPSKRHRQKRSSVLNEGKTSRKSLQMVERQLQEVYPSLKITQKCSKVWKPLRKKVPLSSLASLVNITVKLDKGTRRKAWVKRLRKKAYRIYRIYRRFNGNASSQIDIPLLSYPSKPPLLKKKDVRLNIIRFTKKSRLVVNVVFRLEIKEPGKSNYSKVKSAAQIIKAINSTGPGTMARVFNGIVLAITDAKKTKVETNSLWTSNDTAKALKQFPSHLRSYFRFGMERMGRCLVMIYISTNLQKDLRPVEMFYNSHNYLPKKYFCLHKKSISVNMSIRYIANETFPKSKENKERGKNTIKKEKNLLLEKINERDSNITYAFPVSEQPDVDEKDGKEVEETSSRRKVTALEIGLFTVLAFLCLAIAAFTINCIMFAFKKRSAHAAGKPPPKSAFALFSKVNETNLKETSENTPRINLALPKAENAKIDTKLGRTTKDSPSKHKSSNTPQQIDSEQNVYSMDPLRSIVPDSSEPLKTKEIAQNILENGESNDDVFSEHLSSGASIEVNNDISTDHRGSKQRTLKESCGEMRLLSESDNMTLSNRRDVDPYIKNNTIQVVVVF
ncbi:hypothetical protein AC249_AIPGENE1191 [Exaiptasia diaphana]|nr:hypothetical protein AC249_AIPGENE1191 [Exaiptasia diaphana]